MAGIGISQTDLQVMLQQLQQQHTDSAALATTAAADAAAAAQKAAMEAQTAMMERLAQLFTTQSAQTSPTSDQMAAATAAAIAAADKAKETALQRKSDTKLDEKSYKRIESFAGGDDEWTEWRYDFEIITRGVNPGVGRALTDINNSSEPMGLAQFIGDMTNDPWRPALRSAELYQLLIMLTTGEAKTIIKQATEDGFLAWQMLNDTYSRKTLAKTLRIYREASNPAPATHISEVLSNIAKWEGKVQALAKTNAQKKMDPMLKLAALTEICTPELKDFIFQNMDEYKMGTEDGIETAFKSIKEKIISWVSNRLSAAKSVGLNVGNGL